MLHNEDLCYLYSLPSVVDVEKSINGTGPLGCAATLLIEACIRC